MPETEADHARAGAWESWSIAGRSTLGGDIPLGQIFTQRRELFKEFCSHCALGGVWHLGHRNMASALRCPCNYGAISFFHNCCPKGTAYLIT